MTNNLCDVTHVTKINREHNTTKKNQAEMQNFIVYSSMSPIESNIYLYMLHIRHAY